MGRVLLIEPQRLLRQAISLALFPEHEVRAEDAASASTVGSFKEYDLLIVDGAALRDKEELTPDLAQAVKDCKVPTLWLEEDEPPQLPKREKLLVLKKPIEREAFQSALAALLQPRGAQGSAGGSKGKREPPKAPRQATFEFIDLVDVVEEGPPAKEKKRSPRKSK